MPEGTTALGRAADLLLRHRRLVIVFWLVVLVAGVAASSAVTSRMTFDLSLPGEPAYEANTAMLRTYDAGALNPLVPVITLPPGSSVRSAKAQLADAFAAAGRAMPDRVAWYGNTGDRRFVSPDGRTTFGLVLPSGSQWMFPTDQSKTVISAMRPALPRGATLRVTGITPLASSGSGGSNSFSVLGVTLIGAIGALAVLAFVFGSLLALAPLLVALVAIFAIFLGIGVIETFASVNAFLDALIALLGLGLAIDYSLLMVTRWREELHRGHSGSEAARRAMLTAGRSVLLSGITVAVGLLTLVLVPVPFVRSLGYSSMLIPLISAVVAVTLVPAVLAAAGRRLDWPRWRTEDSASRGWVAWTRRVVRVRWAAVALGVAALAALAWAAPGLKLGDPQSSALAKSGPAYQGLASLRSASVPSGVLTPVNILLPQRADVPAAVGRLRKVGGVWDVLSPGDAAWHRQGTALVTVLPAAESGTDQGRAAIQRIRLLAARDLPGARVGGTGPQNLDFVHAVYSRFPLILGLLALVAFVILMRAFRSAVLAIKAIVLDLLSITAVLGALVLIWQRGYGSHAIWGIPATGAVVAFVPVMVFAFLFGLSMDYEVFLLSRIREEYDRTGSTDEAVVQGIGRTGRLVTSAAIILFFAFAALSAYPSTEAKEYAVALGVGVLLDATVVRSLLVPALVAGFGRWNWWLPRWAARVLRIPQSAAPLQAPRPESEQGAVPLK